MELMEAIRTRRSTRAYGHDPLDREVIQQLVRAAALAPSAMNLQPWAFGVIVDPARLHDLSERTKRHLLEKISEWPWLERFRESFANPEFHVFYHAPAVIAIYARDAQPMSRIDCALAAQNLMLTARDLGLGSCWIGFAGYVLDLPEVKREMGVPDGYAVVAPIAVGHPAGESPAPEKKAPEVLFWV